MGQIYLLKHAQTGRGYASPNTHLSGEQEIEKKMGSFQRENCYSRHFSLIKTPLASDQLGLSGRGKESNVPRMVALEWHFDTPAKSIGLIGTQRPLIKCRDASY